MSTNNNNREKPREKCEGKWPNTVQAGKIVRVVEFIMRFTHNIPVGSNDSWHFCGWYNRCPVDVSVCNKWTYIILCRFMREQCILVFYVTIIGVPYIILLCRRCVCVYWNTFSTGVTTLDNNKYRLQRDGFSSKTYVQWVTQISFKMSTNFTIDWFLKCKKKNKKLHDSIQPILVD